MTQQAALAVAKRQQDEEGDDIRILETGVRVRLRPVAAFLISDATALIPDPDVPTWHNHDKERDEPNPNDPAYLKGLAEARHRRVQAANDTLVMFGVELLDGLPEDESWLKQLCWLEKRGKLDLSSYDLDDELDKEFLFKRYIALTSKDFQRIGRLTHLTTEDITDAEASFRGDGRRGTDPDAGAEEPA